MTAVSCGPARFRPWRDSRAVSCARRLRARAPRTGFDPMKWRTLIIAALGLALALYLVWYVGLGAILAAAVAVGWGGFALLCLGSVALFGLLGSAWHVLLPASSGAGAWIFVRARLVRDSASEVLPFSQLGGIAIGARALVLQGVSAPLASASLIVDVTTEMLAQIAYLALGIAIVSARLPRTSIVTSLTRAALISLALGAIASVLFLAVQRYGQRITARIAAAVTRGAGQVVAAVGASLDAIYRSPGRVAASLGLHIGGWIGNALVAWMAFRLIGSRIELASVVAIESLVAAARSVGVLVPNALGVQEAAYTVLTPLFGAGAELGLAVSLLKRARDIVLGVPVLLVWQAIEGRRALAGAAGADAPGEP
ncbi:MAG: HpnL family protein [Gammaproteobacteria bacterium]|nr:MAG: HpnL family protein [Gammaproteobacteria bacterium]